MKDFSEDANRRRKGRKETRSHHLLNTMSMRKKVELKHKTSCFADTDKGRREEMGKMKTRKTNNHDVKKTHTETRFLP